jgi:hypothetical protein
MSVQKRATCKGGFWVCAILAALLGAPATGFASDAKVFPVGGVFWDDSDASSLDKAFVTLVKEPAFFQPLVAGTYKALSEAFTGRAADLSSRNADHVFAVSLNLTRATAYSVDKGNGNRDVVATVSGSVYFTNVMTGEILTVVTKTEIGRAVIDGKDSIPDTTTTLFRSALASLVPDLADAAAKTFTPVLVEAKVSAVLGKTFVLDGGYERGIQAGDQLEDADLNLIKIDYSAQAYAIAELSVGKAPVGSTFHKYMAAKSDGRIRPRLLVIAEQVPAGYSVPYVEQLFSDLLGDKAPYSIVQVNPKFSQLLTVVLGKADLSATDAQHRSPPDLFLTLRMGAPIQYEVPTNLQFQTTRNHFAVSFADIVDVNARVNASAVGSSRLSDDITKGVGPGLLERREVVIRNALTDLANNVVKIGDTHRDANPLVAGGQPGALAVSSAGKAFFADQKGVVLRKTAVKVGTATLQMLVPVSLAKIDSEESPGMMRIRVGAPIDSDKTPAPGDLFEVERRGPTPRVANRMAVCGVVEHLGAAATPELSNLAENALGSLMPGVLYAPGVQRETQNISTAEFSSAVAWDVPDILTCIQPVDRVDVGDEACTQQCDRAVTAKFTLRVKRKDEVLSRAVVEDQFHSDGFYKPITPAQVDSVIQADLIREALTQYGKAATALTLPP